MLCTRVYRGMPPEEGPGSGEPLLSLSCEGGEAGVLAFEVHEMSCAWARGAADAPLPSPVTAAKAGCWTEEAGLKGAEQLWQTSG